MTEVGTQDGLDVEQLPDYSAPVGTDFAAFDPLAHKSTRASDAAFLALKREISNILSSYVGWYDPFAELIQNALDAVDARRELESTGTGPAYQPRIHVLIDIESNTLTVTDNGIGLDQDKFEQFLAPNFSFKTGNTRGHKGVGATYVAYGFNYMRVTTRTPGFEASGRIRGARNWVKGKGTGSNNPRVEPDTSELADPTFNTNDRGVSITVRFDDATHPKKLEWLSANDAETWTKILSVKTGLGSVVQHGDIAVSVEVVAKGGNRTTHELDSTKYLWLHETANKKGRLTELNKVAQETFDKHGAKRNLPDRYRNLDFIYESWTPAELEEALKDHLDEEDLAVLEEYPPTVSMEYGYTAKLWNQFNSSLNIRSGQKILTPGIQLAANNMPQGETILIPLTRNIGRQNQVHFLIHFDNYTPDMGRKGFHRELTDFAKNVAVHLMENFVYKRRDLLKANTGVSPDLIRKMKIDDWKKDMLQHEEAEPLSLASEHFFRPTERIAITSTPTREQDVIALFHQLIAGGVIRGMHIMSTNEYFTYDGLFKVAFDLAPEIYAYDPQTNPLGIPLDNATALGGRTLGPNILEYKYSLDGLMEDLDANDKNLNEIDLAIAWESGKTYAERYGIKSLLIDENADQREYHGVTHVLYDKDTLAKHCDLVILSELVAYLNSPEETAELQRAKYE
ncbi:ATP-binding protein [Arthrobacter sp. ISL-85]|uniref:ATP-binding protein n=1 Tax=Arthrobacter sp. ISL-85 TaxID=2819115 RepID=UPI001BE98FEF|nr:ATP-binding protein [Arthrobacter sp. ISL-85]